MNHKSNLKRTKTMDAAAVARMHTVLARRLQCLDRAIASGLLPLVSDAYFHRLARAELRGDDPESLIDDACRARVDTVRELAHLKRNIHARRAQLDAERSTPGEDTAVFLYCREAWISENGAPDNAHTSEVVINILEGLDGDADAILHTFPDLSTRGRKRQLLKVRNLVAVTRGVFRDGDFPEDAPLTEALAHALHRRVMAGLMDDTDVGAYRVVAVGASGTFYMYLEPSAVPAHTAALMSFAESRRTEIRESEDSSNEKFERTITLATLFFVEFLKIHPYRNGNGRVARLLFSHIMRSSSRSVPFSMFSVMTAGSSAKAQRALYINTLVASRDDALDSVPYAALRWVLECTLAHMFDLVVSKGLEYE